MVAKHSVKVNGVWYRAGEEIAPAKTEAKEKNFLDEFAENEKDKKETYTKTDINRMPVAELREMAMRTGVEGANTWSGAELKEYLITILGL